MNTWPGSGSELPGRCRRSRPTSSPAAWWMPCSAWACPRRSMSRSPAPTCSRVIAPPRSSPARSAGSMASDDIFIPQDIDYPALQLDIDRTRAKELGLTQKEVVGNIITALTSNAMIAPSFWIDPKTGNDYMLTVQYPGAADHRASTTCAPSRSAARTSRNPRAWMRLQHPADQVAHRSGSLSAPPRDRYLCAAARRGPGPHRQRPSTSSPRRRKCPTASPSRCAGWCRACGRAFRSFGIGLILSVVLLYLILVAQFRSFLDPVLILTAVPPGLTGALVIFM